MSGLTVQYAKQYAAILSAVRSWENELDYKPSGTARDYVV